MRDLQTFFYRDDPLSELNEDRPLNEKFAIVHGYLRHHLPVVVRIAVALYDKDTDDLKTYAHSTLDGANPLPLYDAKLRDSASLREILERRKPRVVNDMDLYGMGSKHARRLRGHGYGSSYTMPIFATGEFLGFLFFNTIEKGAFDEAALHLLDALGHLLALLIIDGLAPARALVATVRSATGLAQHRDFETGAHMDRVAHYSRLIAKEVAARAGLTDALVELIFLYAPLHDIGKIGIPDQILLKRDRLSEAEYAIVQTHTTKGGEIVDAMLGNFRIEDTEHSRLLRNIVLFHHEAMDGSGYPTGSSGDEIPIEARIVSVADVFDALTSVRPYKEAWSVEDSLKFLTEKAGSHFDPHCVGAMVRNRDEIEKIRARFREDPIG